MKTRLIIAAVAALGMTAAFAGGHKKMDAAEVDTNADGYISLDEMKAHSNARIEKHFAKVDANGDGLLSADEQRAAHEGMREHAKGKRKGRHNPEQVVEHLDADGSGSVSLAEFEGTPFNVDADSFTAADTNGNGELDANELAAMMKARHGERRGGWKGGEDRADRADRS